MSASEITVTVMADVGSPLAPGLFQGNIDGVKAFADWINANGGIGCRQLVVNTWDSKLDPTESKNGLIDSCTNSLSLVGGNSLFNPDVDADDRVRRQGRRRHRPAEHRRAGQRRQRAVRGHHVHDLGARRGLPRGGRASSARSRS